MKLVEDWDKILTKAWSVKFAILAALMSGVEVAVQMVKPASIPDGVFAGIATMVSVMATLARVLHQQELSGGKDGSDS
jgi:hypothetical protein